MFGRNSRPTARRRIMTCVILQTCFRPDILHSMLPLVEIEKAAMRGEVHSIRAQLASAQKAAFRMQRDVVDALCEISRMRRCLSSYRDSSLFRLSRPIISAEEAAKMDASRDAIYRTF